MDYMDAENSITTTVEKMLPRFSDRKLGLYFCLDIKAYSEKFKKRNFSKIFSLLFIRSSNYTKVFSIVLNDYLLLPNIVPIKMSLQSDHDSCWRSDGLNEIFQIVAKGCEQVDQDKPFRDSNPSISYHPFGGIKYFLIDYDLYHNYEKDRSIDITFIKSLTVQEAVKYMPKNIAKKEN